MAWQRPFGRHALISTSGRRTVTTTTGGHQLQQLTRLQLDLCTQAGTYVKEFVHSDFGRTHPSVGSLLGCEADILQLDVLGLREPGAK